MAIKRYTRTLGLATWLLIQTLLLHACASSGVEKAPAKPAATAVAQSAIKRQPAAVANPGSKAVRSIPPAATAASAATVATATNTATPPASSRLNLPVISRLNQISPELLANRLTWGANASTLAQIRQIGAGNYLQQQLNAANPADLSALPPSVQSQIGAMSIVQTPLLNLMQQMDAMRDDIAPKMADGMAGAGRKVYQHELDRLALEAASRSLWRAMYSPQQLQEQMVWFWMNHFNIHIAKHNARAMLGDFEEQAIRPHAMGRFQDLLNAATMHPAMLRYLDNEHNAVKRINENHARELLELHTMGVNSGYSQRDVQELARVLTGFTTNIRLDKPKMRPMLEKWYVRRGMFEFHPGMHDFGSKEVLGNTIEGQGLPELEQVLALLSRQEATARFISRKLAIYFVSDTPSPALLAKMTRSFLQSDGNIRVVLHSMFDSDEFVQSLGKKFKDPLHYMLSVLRLSYDPHDAYNPYQLADENRVIRNAWPMVNWLRNMGQVLNGKQTPDGYAMTEDAWASPAQMVTRFDFARLLANGTPQLFRYDPASAEAKKTGKPDKVAGAPALAGNPLVQAQLKNFSANSKAALAQAGPGVEWDAFFLAAPEMMRR